jgi:pimeloyl-ACP methyl ester carboxylesterase
MARFVLVHGAFAGAWIWEPLIECLKATGHSAEAFDLPGLGNDHTAVSDCTLDACAARLCEVLGASSQPAIMVGHSMGGVIITQAAARSRENVSALVYVAAFMPKDGQSLLDLTRLPEGAGDQVQANIVIEGNPPVAVMPAAASPHALYSCCAQDVAARAIERQRPQPVAPFATAVCIPPGSLDGIDRFYVVCTWDQAMPVALQRRMISENPCMNIVELETDHSPQLSMPSELAQALVRFAGSIT